MLTAPANPHSHRVILPTGSLFFLRVMQNRRDQVLWPAHIPICSLFFLGSCRIAETRYLGQPTSLPGCCSFSGHEEWPRPGILAIPHSYMVVVLSLVMQNRRDQVFWPAHNHDWLISFLRIMKNRRDQVFCPAHIPTWSLFFIFS